MHCPSRAITWTHQQAPAPRRRRGHEVLFTPGQACAGGGPGPQSQQWPRRIGRPSISAPHSPPSASPSRCTVRRSPLPGRPAAPLPISNPSGRCMCSNTRSLRQSSCTGSGRLSSSSRSPSASARPRVSALGSDWFPAALFENARYQRPTGYTTPVLSLCCDQASASPFLALMPPQAAAAACPRRP